MFAISIVGDMQGGYFTKDGKKIEGSDFTPPPGANDMHMSRRIVIIWTKDGQPHGGTIAPEDANDVHFASAGAKEHDASKVWRTLAFNTPPDLRK
jgi:hypothetical protein